MKRKWRGFTIIEVSLFLAITAAVFVGVVAGTQNSIFQQRYNDAVQSFTEFLRTVYSQVTNVQNESDGRSNQAIYGKLVIFGNKDGENKITSYNVIGDDNRNPEGSSTLEKLANLNVSIKKGNGEFVGFVEDYTPRWSSQIQTTAGWSGGYTLFTGALLIVRHPDSGAVYTFIKRGQIDEANPFASIGDFKREDVDFCVNPNGAGQSNLRRDVRIIKDTRNASGIEIMSDNTKTDNGVNIGNRCE